MARISIVHTTEYIDRNPVGPLPVSGGKNLKAALGTFGPPLVMLALGSLIGWIFAGFARD
jgi:hypothetical protein